MQKLGSGSYGTVYKLKTTHGKEHAIKTSKIITQTIGLNDLREVDISLRLRHPYVVQILDYTTSYVIENSQKYKIVYPVANETLIELSEKIIESNLGQDYFIKYFFQLLLGLNYVHERDIILVDIKPDNILYFEDEDSLRYNDFGLSIYDDKVFKNQIAGTKYYAAPELFFNVENKNKSIREIFTSLFLRSTNSIQENVLHKTSDIWSLGMTFIYVLTGILPQYETFIEADIKTFNSFDEYEKYFLSLLQRKINYALMRIENTNIIIMLKKMLDIDYKKRATTKELISLPIFDRYKTLEKLVQKLYVGYPIRLLFVNSHDFRNYPNIYSALNYSFSKCENIGEFWAWFNAIDILNYLMTVHFVRSDDRNLAFASLILSLKIYSRQYYEPKNIIIFIEPNINVNFDDIEKLEDEIFNELSGKIYRKNIFSFLYNLTEKIDYKKLSKFVLEIEFEGEMPNYAFEFLSSNGILNEKEIIKDMLKK